jgi:hypothetical protein
MNVPGLAIAGEMSQMGLFPCTGQVRIDGRSPNIDAQNDIELTGFSPVRPAHNDHENAEDSDGDQISNEESSDIGDDSASERT